MTDTKVIFEDARTYTAWQERPVTDDLLRQIYDLAKLGPTSSNCCPMRVVFVKSPEAKARLNPCLNEGNVEKTMKAPVTAILAHDLAFYEKQPTLVPDKPAMRELFANSPELAKVTAFRNGTLQGGYFILAARSVGLDCGPISGFDNAKVDREFFPADASSKARVESNFLCNLGYGDAAQLPPRNPRLDFDEACQLL